MLVKYFGNFGRAYFFLDDTQVLKVEKVKESRNQKLKKLGEKLREIARNAE